MNHSLKTSILASASLRWSSLISRPMPLDKVCQHALSVRMAE